MKNPRPIAEARGAGISLWETVARGSTDVRTLPGNDDASLIRDLGGVPSPATIFIGGLLGARPVMCLAAGVIVEQQIPVGLRLAIVNV
jgi:hypothetical protein